MSFDDKKFKRLQLTIPLKMLDYLFGYERIISFLLKAGGVQQYSALMDKHRKLVHLLGLEKHYAQLTVFVDSEFLLKFLPTFPRVLVEIIVDYTQLSQENSEDLDEIYNRLLKIDWTNELHNQHPDS